MKSVVIGKSQCPKCARNGNDTNRDNLILYSDGGSYCFACGYFTTASGHQRMSKTDREVTKKVILPHDVDATIQPIGQTWLNKYNLTEKEICDNLILWSTYRQQLIFPYLDKNKELIAYQARQFNDPSKPKWFSQGNLNEVYNIIGRITLPNNWLRLYAKNITTEQKQKIVNILKNTDKSFFIDMGLK